MITEKDYLEAKKIVQEYKTKHLNISAVSGCSRQLIFDCPEPKWHNGDITRYGVCTFCDNKKLIEN